MAIDPDAVEEIRARTVLSALVGRTVALKRAGREFVGLSPFNKEKTPSFYVNDEKRFFHCFSSGKSGDAFTWLMETEGLSFREAAERLAADAGVESPIRQDPQAAARAQERKELGHWLEEANTFFQAELRRSRGAQARAYLDQRGVTATDWERFEIGFAPDGWSTLKDHLIGKGARVDELVRAGLLAVSDRGKDPFGYFRNRIMFAIRDSGRRLVGFGGRALSPEERAKYLNSPERDIFQKGRLLYRFAEARASLARAPGAGGQAEARPRGLIVVEGYMDAIALARVGIGHAVAPLGTALTEDQLKLLWTAGPEPVMCFDGDAAGVRAAHRAMDRALPMLAARQSLRFAFIPDGRDPDDVVREEGPAAMEAVLASARPFIDVLWEREEAAAPLETPEQRADLKGRLFAAAARIEDEAVSSQYRQMLLERYDERFGWKAKKGRGKYNARSGGRRPYRPGERYVDPDAPPHSDTVAAARASRLARVRDARRLLRAVMVRPELLDAVAETLAQLELDDPDHQAVRDALLDAAENVTPIDKLPLDVHFANHGLDAVVRPILDNRGGAVAPICSDDDDDAAAVRAWERAAAAYAVLVTAQQEARLRQDAIRARQDAEDTDGLRSATGHRPHGGANPSDASAANGARAIEEAVSKITARANAALSRKRR